MTIKVWRLFPMLLAAALLFGGCVTNKRGERIEQDIVALRVQLETLSQSMATNQKDTLARLDNLDKQLQTQQHVSQVTTASDHVELEHIKDEVRRMNGLMENQGYNGERNDQALASAFEGLSTRVAVLETKSGITPPPAQNPLSGAAKLATVPASAKTADSPAKDSKEPKDGKGVKPGKEPPAEPTATTSSDPANAKDLFAKAKGLTAGKKANQGEARRLFTLFLQKYPKDAQAPKAQLNLGYTYYAEKKYAPAIREFQKLTEGGKDKDAQAEALLMIGESFKALGMKEDAKTFYEECVARHPKTPSADKAKAALKKM